MQNKKKCKIFLAIFPAVSFLIKGGGINLENYSFVIVTKTQKWFSSVLHCAIRKLI